MRPTTWPASARPETAARYQPILRRIPLLNSDYWRLWTNGAGHPSHATLTAVVRRIHRSCLGVDDAPYSAASTAEQERCAIPAHRRRSTRSAGKTMGLTVHSPLGHGIAKTTPPEHVTALAEQVRAWTTPVPPGLLG